MGGFLLSRLIFFPFSKIKIRVKRIGKPQNSGRAALKIKLRPLEDGLNFVPPIRPL